MVKAYIIFIATLSLLAIENSAFAFYEEKLKQPSSDSAPHMEIIEPPSAEAVRHREIKEDVLPDSSQAQPSRNENFVPAASNAEVLHVRQIGRGSLSQVASRGNLVPLRYALPLLLPRGWSHEIGVPLNSKKVSWQAESNWISTLSSICSQSGAKAVVDWNQRKVEMYETHSQASSPVAITPDEAVRDTGGVPTKQYRVRKAATAAQVAKRNHIRADDFCRWNGVKPNHSIRAGDKVYLSAPSQQQGLASEPAVPVLLPTAVDYVSDSLPVENIHEAPPIVLLESWDIKPGGLRIQIHAWAARAGYQLVWKAGSDFEMEATATFEGEFLKAVETLFAGMQHSGHALRVTVYQANNVLEVTEG